MRWVVFFCVVACGTSGQPEPEAEAAPSSEKATAAEAATPAAEAATPATRNDAEWKYFGEPFTLASRPASEVLAAPGSHEGRVRMEGELTQVCQKAGCWAVVRDDAGHSIRVTMKDHAFGIDKDAAGKACDVEGELVSRKVDPDKLAHFEEEGATEHPEAGKEEAWELVAASVAIAR